VDYSFRKALPGALSTVASEGSGGTFPLSRRPREAVQNSSILWIAEYRVKGIRFLESIL